MDFFEKEVEITVAEEEEELASDADENMTRCSSKALQDDVTFLEPDDELVAQVVARYLKIGMLPPPPKKNVSHFLLILVSFFLSP